MRSRHKKTQNVIITALVLLIALQPMNVFAAKSQGLEASVERLRDGMAARQSSVLLYLYSWVDFTQEGAMRDDLFYAACSEEHATSYNTGAYLKSSVKSCDVSAQKISVEPERWKISFSNIVYRTTAEQEAEFDQRLQEVMKELDIAEQSDYQKCSAIYHYITEHVRYDEAAYEAHLNGDDTNYDLAYTAYSALMDGTAVCQGYATLFYAMCKCAGLEVLMVDGIAQGRDGWGEHAWNMVRIDGYWYQADPTWDTENSLLGYKYFLQGTETFKKHRLNLEYTQDSFTSTHIMPLNGYKNNVNENPVVRLVKKLKQWIIGK